MSPSDTARYVEPNEETPLATRVEDVRIRDVRPIISPALLQYELPITDAAQRTVEDSRSDVAAILRGQDERLLVVVGPAPSTTASRRWPTRAG